VREIGPGLRTILEAEKLVEIGNRVAIAVAGRRLSGIRAAVVVGIERGARRVAEQLVAVGHAVAIGVRIVRVGGRVPETDVQAAVFVGIGDTIAIRVRQQRIGGGAVVGVR